MKNKFILLAGSIVEHFPKLAIFYWYIKNSCRYIKYSWRYVKDRWEIYTDTKQTKIGFKFVGNKNMQNGQFEPEETRIVKKIISSYADVVINIGANIGYYCCIALAQKKYVIAFEPIDFNVRYLLLNVKANNWENQIEVYPIALCNKIGIVEIYGAGTGASLLKGWAGTPEQHVNLVPCSTLDKVLGVSLQSKRCFIIVDIEGVEQLMLEGASFIINMDPKPIWMMEIAISEHQPNGVSINPNLLSTFHVFWDRGYEAWTADKECRAIHPAEIEEIVKGGMATFRARNFLFIEKGKKGELLNL